MAASKPALGLEVKLIPKQPTRVGAGKRDFTILSEQGFAEVIRIERRRSERSGNPFILILLSGWTVDAEGCGKVMSSISQALFSCTRETDVLGWYETRDCLGLLLTEIGRADERTVDIVTRKVSDALQHALEPKEFARLAIVIRVYPLPAGGDEEGERLEIVYPDLSKPSRREQRDRILKRVVDIAGSLFALILFSPVFVIIALLVKLTSKGPVFYCHKRVGQYGRLFDFYKFRSMYVDNDPTIHRQYVTQLIDGADGLKQGNGTYKLVHDPRITRLGRFIRRTSLDELPQFVNVLRGDMSLVGPRPPLPYEFDIYRPWHKRRVVEIQPGLTGRWQIEGRSRTTFDEMVRMDIRYAKTRSLLHDIKIILQTPRAMFSGNGAF